MASTSSKGKPFSLEKCGRRMTKPSLSAACSYLGRRIRTKKRTLSSETWTLC